MSGVLRSGLHFCLGALGLVLLAGIARTQSGDEKPCRADYTIRARYEEGQHMLLGEEVIRWKNESRDDVTDLWFHLYWNAFANEESTHLLESGGALRGVGIQADEWGWQRITSLVIDGIELAPKLEWMAPDDKRTEDHTVFRVLLPRMARRGESIVAQVKWEARVPRVRRRTGYKDDFLFIAQWFPKLGVYETGNGWNCHQFHASTEFFSNYGTYDVELDLPPGYDGKVGASGVEIESARDADGRVKLRYAAPSVTDRELTDRTGKLPLVHDFAWTADRDYVKYAATFRFDEWKARYAEEVDRVALSLGRGREEMRLRDVDVTVLLQPEHAEQGKRHFDATCTALFFYGLWWGEYPYEHITVVDPAWGGGAAGGMEYPTLFTAGTRMFTRREMQSPESVIVHECGHQFWYGLVGNNEFEAGWLDEGFNTFTQNDALALRYGASIRTTDFSGYPFEGIRAMREPGGGALADALAGRRFMLPRGIVLEPVGDSGPMDWWRAQPLLTFAHGRVDPRESERTGYLDDPSTDPVDTHGWLYADRRSYRTNSYRRTATALRSLRGLVGEERFLRGMRYYSESWRYRHPYPQDFFDAFMAGADVDVSWYFDQAFRSTAGVDWKVEVEQKKSGAPRGYFLDGQGQWVQREAADKSATSAKRDPDDKASGWRVDLMVRREGELILPLTIEMTFADGSKRREVWSREAQARSTWWRPLDFAPVFKHKLVSAVLDPDARYHFDANLRDNAWYAESDTVTPLRWSERVFSQYAHLLHWWGGIGG
jgi:hypothetical protein